ncbi:ead/Ea22-like family protein [Citrobacter koseri]|uniref:ead/Ea22-like family protein n=1 Tax=Citrobacter koseri TaxID=545 RepID=UPI0019036472|nr:ead/Ea22-like family protein [Citrobacter koseri]MBJ9121013.1 ead/Ea22-like family protein [Citrobacter koseri]
MTDKQALRKAAIAATGGKWVFSRSGANSNVQAPIELQKGGRALVVLCKLNNAGWSGQIQTENNAKFIAAANPEIVLALLDELEASEHTAAVDHEAACSLVEENEEVKRKLVAAEKRIAELEAREVKLPKRSVGEVMHMSGFSRDYAEGWCSGNDNAIHEIHLAGVKVAAAGIGKGE